MNEKTESKESFALAMCERTKKARQDAGHTQESMAKAIGMDLTYLAYQKYESNVPMPHIYIFQFCNLTKISLQHLLTGKYRLL